MKRIIFLFVFSGLTSCTAFKQLTNEDVIVKNKCTDIIIENKQPLISLEIDNAKSRFLFDTGATRSVLLDSTVVANFVGKKFFSIGSIQSGDGKKTKHRFLTVSLNSELFKSENKVLSFLNMPTSKCSKTKKKYSGILGLDVFVDKNLSMQLDFTNNKVCNLTLSETESLVKEGHYTLIKSSCKVNQIFVFLNIEGKEFKCKLDTGYNGNVIIPNNDGLEFKNGKKIELEGSLYTTASAFTNGKEILYGEMPVTLGSENIETKISVSNSIKAQVIGMEFIKGFNWIVDYKNNKVYIKRNQNKVETDFKKVTYYSKANNEKLVIVIKEKSQTKFNLGDQIISVNKNAVTPANICEMQELLNKTEDWNLLQIETVPELKQI